MTEKILKSLKQLDVWKIVTIILAILLVVSILTDGFSISGFATKEMPKGEAVEKSIEFMNTYLVQPGTDVSIVESSEEFGLYKATFSVEGSEFEGYITKDGKMLFPQGIDMTQAPEMPEAPEQQPANIPKSDKPKVELFIMSHCPFGTQMEKGVIPVVKALGDDIDFTLRFVYYAMHGETEVYEQLNQYCIQKEQESKFIPYLECFLADGNGEACLADIGINMDKLDACVEEADEEFKATQHLEERETYLSEKYPLFDVDKEANEQYGVQGSPTLIVNGVKASSGRDSASVLSAVCGAFTEMPAGCDVELPSEQPSPGFGYEAATGVTTTATCS